MVIPPKYILTPKISSFLSSIEACQQVINSHPLPAEVEANIRRQSTLKSSLFSARIEGNKLTLNEVTTKPSKDLEKVEVFNILKALNFIHQHPKRRLAIKDILRLREIVMDGLTVELGRFRKEVSAIFNSAGIAVYMPPPPKHLNTLIGKLFAFINSQKEPFVPIRAALSHFSFEKIHPFLDGNGRVGRILLQMVLQIGGYDMKGLLSIEEYLDKNRALYYQSLGEKEKDVTHYLEFMLEAIAKTAEEAKNLVLEKKDIRPEDSLLPRRVEILNILRDHQMMSFDQIRRRFMAVNERTLRYDLKKLVDGDFIKKRGATKGVYYEAS